MILVQNNCTQFETHLKNQNKKSLFSQTDYYLTSTTWMDTDVILDAPKVLDHRPIATKIVHNLNGLTESTIISLNSMLSYLKQWVKDFFVKLTGNP